MQANGGGHATHPLDCNFLPGSSSRIERDELKKIVTTEQASRSPVARLALVAWRQWLVDQVIAKHRRTRRARSRDTLPKRRLGRPSRRLLQCVIPCGNVGGPITSQTSKVQMKLCLFCQ